MQVSKEFKKTINRNPFNEKLIHRYYLESLYFFDNTIDKSSLIPKLENPRIKFNNLALVVPEDARKIGYRPDFTLYFKNYQKELTPFGFRFQQFNLNTTPSYWLIACIVPEGKSRNALKSYFEKYSKDKGYSNLLNIYSSVLSH